MTKKKAQSARVSTTMVSIQGATATIRRIRIQDNPKLHTYYTSIQLRKFTKWVDGSMIHGSIKGRFADWMPYRGRVDNLVDACIEATCRMRDFHQGYVVYRRIYNERGTTKQRDKLFEAKWGGHNRLPYIALSTLGRGILGKTIAETLLQSLYHVGTPQEDIVGGTL